MFIMSLFIYSLDSIMNRDKSLHSESIDKINMKEYCKSVFFDFNQTLLGNK